MSGRAPPATAPIAAAPFILASASPRRRDLLAQLGLTPAAVDPADLDETPLPRELPRAHAIRVAAAKAAIVAARHPGAIVLAADTVVGCGRRILPKAEDVDTARRCLALLSGRRHRVVGAICVRAPDLRHVLRVSTTIVAFKRLSTAEIDAYLASGEWHGKAGGYAIQGRAAAFVPFIRGSYSNVVGLDLHLVAQILHGLRA